MALLHRAQLVPSKLELLSGWLPARPWFHGTAQPPAFELAGAYRFDDPDGEVGIETHLLTDPDGTVWQAPLTYRAAPFDAAESGFVGTLEHSVLGTRFVYDGCADPVYAQALATAVLTGGRQADLEIATGDTTERREATTLVSGSGAAGSTVPTIGAVHATVDGTSTVIECGSLTLVVLHRVDAPVDPAPAAVLTGTWPGRDRATLLALAR